MNSYLVLVLCFFLSVAVCALRGRPIPEILGGALVSIILPAVVFAAVNAASKAIRQKPLTPFVARALFLGTWAAVVLVQFLAVLRAKVN
jgi:hypothetical protein